MPAHLGIKDRIKLPAALVVIKLKSLLAQRSITSGTSYDDVMSYQEHSRQAREVHCTSHSSYETAVAAYGPGGHGVQVPLTEWTMYLGPSGYVDMLLSQSFDYGTARSVTLIARRTARLELKRVEVTWATGDVQIVWTCPRT